MSRRVLLAAPRSFCAGVDRAIEIVERLLEQHGPPVYVRHQIVHNEHVVRRLEQLGAVFVEDESEIPEGEICVLSAHGVAPSVKENASRRGLRIVDATCPLVNKVHAEARRYADSGHLVALVGHENHVEVIGTLGERPESTVVIESPEQARELKTDKPVAVVTQTTLSLDDTAGIVAALKRRFPDIAGPHKEDICYATTNRQEAVKRVAPKVDAMIVVGAPNSSNSQRLKEVAERSGCPFAALVQRAADIDWSRFGAITSLGVTAGASAPEVLVEEILGAFESRYQLRVETVTATEEDVFFPLPRALRHPEAAE